MNQPPTPPPPQEPWRRLDPRMILVQPVMLLGRFLPVLVGLVIVGPGDGFPWEALGLLPVAAGVVDYLTTWYRTSAERVEMRRGVLKRRHLVAALDRVRSVDVTASPVHRVLGVASVRITTGSGAVSDDDRLELPGLSRAAAEGLRHDLLDRAAALGDPSVAVPPAAPTAEPLPDAPAPTGSPLAPPPPPSPSPTQPGPAPARSLLAAYDRSWLRVAPFTATGAVLALAVWGVLGQVAVQVLGEVDLPVPTHLDRPASIALAAVVAVLVPAVLVGLSVLSYVLTWGTFRLERGPETYEVSWGQVTTRSATIDAQRVVGVRVREPLLLRAGRGAALSAIVTGTSLADSVSGSTTTLLPAAPRERVLAVAEGVVPGVRARLHGHGPAARRRRLLRAVAPTLLVVAAAVTASALLLPTGWVVAATVVGALALPASVWLGLDRARSLGHLVVDDVLVSRSGSLVRRTDHLHVDAVIGWRCRQTWWQRRAGLVSLTAAVAGAGQSVQVTDVPTAAARTILLESTPAMTRRWVVTTGAG